MLRRRLAGVVFVAVVSVAAVAAYGLPHAGYDAVYSLIWGNEVAHGHTPEFKPPGIVGPTPHPLSNLVGILLAPAGAAAGHAAVIVISIVSLAAVGWFAFRLGRELFSGAVGALFAAILLTRATLVDGMLKTLVDIPALALMLCAGALEAERPRRGVPVLVALGLAGLLRPEAWLLSFAYAVYMLRGRPGPRWAPIAVAALAPPLIWALADLVVTGDPAYSFHHTQTGAAVLERPRDLGAALRSAPTFLRDILGAPLALGGLAATAASLAVFFRRAALPAAVCTLGLVAFLALGVAGLPVLPRYYYVTASMLALFGAVGLAGWRLLPPRSRLRLAWKAGAAVLAVAVAVSLGSERGTLTRVADANAARRRVENDLRSVVLSGPGKRLLRRCLPTETVSRAVSPLIALWLGERPQHDVLMPTSGSIRSVVAIRPHDRIWALDPDRPTAFSVPRGARFVTGNRSWSLYAVRCPVG